MPGFWCFGYICRHCSRGGQLFFHNRGSFFIFRQLIPEIDIQQVFMIIGLPGKLSMTRIFQLNIQPDTRAVIIQGLRIAGDAMFQIRSLFLRDSLLQRF